MSKIKQNKMVLQEEVPTLDETNVVIEEQNVETTPTFVVTRAGLRVSDVEYTSENDPSAISERDFWKRVATKSKDGTKVEIVPFDKKKHRVW